MDTIINCLIADDEPLARLVLEQFVALETRLTLLKSCKNAFEVLEQIQHQKVDLIFLDIKMPDLDGLQLIRTLNTKPKIILTTAFSQFAVDAFDLGVTDYLMKPIGFERFVKAVNKVLGEFPNEKKDTEIANTEDFIYFKADRTFYKILLKDIIRIEAYGNFIKVFTVNQMLVVADKISNLESQLDKHTFLRIHKSHIVAAKYIKEVKANELIIGHETINIGNSYKALFLDWFEKIKG
jgi:DNA-binding LytR/AlgR family response regulator